VSDTWQWGGAVWVQRQDIGPAPLVGASLTDGLDGPILFGGLDALTGNGVSAHGDTWRWDGALWTELQNMGPHPRGLHSAGWDPQAGTVVLFGGIDVALDDPGAATSVRDDTWQLPLGTGAPGPPGPDHGTGSGPPPTHLVVTATPNPVSPNDMVTLTVDLGAPAVAATSVAIAINGESSGVPMPIQAGESSAEIQFVPSEAFGGAAVPNLLKITARVGAAESDTTLTISST
jgi:hypothetical protein